MLLLVATTDKISLITSAAITLDVVVNAQDKTTSTGVLASVSQRTAITTATTTDILAVPGAGIERNCKLINARNKHASLAGDVTVQINQNGTLFELAKYTLNAGDTLEYVEGIGWFIVTNAAALYKKLIVTADVINATTSMADVTGLTCPLLSGKNYNFIAHLYSTNDAATTGSRYSVNIGAAPTALTMNLMQVVTQNVGGVAAVLGTGTSTVRDTAAGLIDTGSTVVKHGILSGYIKPSADGTFAIRCASEVAVAAGITVKAGSWCLIWEATG